jgi:hypothetical protein
MRTLLASVARSALMGAAIGLPVLGIGGRLLMRVIAHWEGRVPVFTIGGTMAVLFAATMAGLAAGAARGILSRFVQNAYLRNVAFAVICVLFTWRAVNALLPRPRLMFVALTLFYVIVVEMVSGRNRIGSATDAPIAVP